MIRRFLGRDFIDPNDLAMLQRVFDATCKETDKTSATADLDALLILSVFQAGFKDENTLLAEIRRRKAGG
jgi:hypothetical protein